MLKHTLDAHVYFVHSFSTFFVYHVFYLNMVIISSNLGPSIKYIHKKGGKRGRGGANQKRTSIVLVMPFLY